MSGAWDGVVSYIILCFNLLFSFVSKTNYISTHVCKNYKAAINLYIHNHHDTYSITDMV
jgi:hypothetical protein